MLDSVDMTQVKDPTSFINAAITSINAGKADEAIGVAGQVGKQFPTVQTFSTIVPARTSSRRRCPRRKPTSKNSSRWRRLTRASCRMPRSFSNSSKTSSNGSLVAACAVRLPSAVRRLWWFDRLWRVESATAAATGSQSRRRQLAEPLRAAVRRARRASAGPGAIRGGSRAARRSASTAIPRGRLFDALWTHRQRIALGGERAAETTDGIPSTSARSPSCRTKAT